MKAICDNMDVSQGHSAKWNKSRKKMPYDLSYMWGNNIGEITISRYRK